MKKESPGFKVFNMLNIFSLSLLTIVFIFPYLNTLARAFNDPLDSQIGGLTVYPRLFSVLNFQKLLQQDAIITALFVSIARVLSGTLISLIVVFACGYAFTKRGYRGRNGFLLFMMIPMYLSGGLIPYYLLVHKIHIMNTFWMYIIPNAFSFFYMVIVRVYINTNIPASIEDAARIDGANEIRTFYSIVLPLCTPILATIGLFSAVGHWNDWTTTLMFVQKPGLATIQFKLMQVLKESEILQKAIMDSVMDGTYRGERLQVVTPESLQAAMVIITTLPIIIVYPFLQKYFLKGVMIGALKD